VNESSENAARQKPLVEGREAHAANDWSVAWRVSTDKFFRGPHTPTLLIFRLTRVIMAVHNRLCKHFLKKLADPPKWLPDP
jgi:hypothetical protein